MSYAPSKWKARDGSFPGEWWPIMCWDWQRPVRWDAEDAAEKAADQVHSDWDFPEQMLIDVMSPDGKITQWEIEVRVEPVFCAIERNGGE